MKVLRRIALISLLTLPTILSACGEDVLISQEQILGPWLRHIPAPPGETSETLTFGADGSLLREIRRYGYYGGDPPGLSSYSQLEAEYRLRGNRLELRPLRETEWDALIGGEPAVRLLSGEWEDAGTVRMDGEELVRTYTTDPAGGPEVTTAVYGRMGGGS